MALRQYFYTNSKYVPRGKAASLPRVDAFLRTKRVKVVRNYE
jgi:hypothetical protein